MEARVENARDVRQGNKTVKKHMMYSTLRTLRFDLRKLARHKANPPMTREELEALDELMVGQVAYLKQEYKLDGRRTKAAIFGKHECRAVIEDLLEYPESWDVAVQSTLLHLVLFHSGLREGSIFPTKTYNGYLKWKQVRIEPIYRPGLAEDGEEGMMVLYGFRVIITIISFKGYQYLESLEIV